MRMILNASSEDGERAASELNPEFLKFFNAKSSGAAGKYLLSYLMSDGLADSFVAEGAVHSMYHGLLINFHPNVIKDFCAFSFQEGSGLTRNQSERFMILHMADVLGKAKTADEINERMSQTIVVPKDYHEMMSCAKRYNSAQGLVFSKASFIVKRYREFIKQLKANKSAIKDISEEDPDICTKILYLADAGIKLWSKDCMECEDREDVDDTYNDFKPIIRSIEKRQVHCILPACFKEISTKKREIDDAIPTAPGNPKDNKQPRIENATKEINENPFEAFKLLKNENYRIFTGKQKAKGRPQYKSTKMCPKWNIKGKCFADCFMKESHVPHDQYSEEQKSAFLKWMTECRECE